MILWTPSMKAAPVCLQASARRVRFRGVARFLALKGKSIFKGPFWSTHYKMNSYKIADISYPTLPCMILSINTSCHLLSQVSIGPNVSENIKSLFQTSFFWRTKNRKQVVNHVQVFQHRASTVQHHVLLSCLSISGGAERRPGALSQYYRGVPKTRNRHGGQQHYTVNFSNIK